MTCFDCCSGCLMGGGLSVYLCTSALTNKDNEMKQLEKRLKNQIELLNATKDNEMKQLEKLLKNQIELLNATNADLLVRHTSALTAAQEKHEAELANLRDRHSSALNEAQLEVTLQTSRVVRLREEICDKDSLLREKDMTIRSLQVSILEKDSRIEGLREEICDKDSLLREKDMTIRSLQDSILEKDSRIEALSRQEGKASPEYDDVESSSGLCFHVISSLAHCFDEIPMHPRCNNGVDETSKDDSSDSSSENSFEVVHACSGSAPKESKCFMPNTGFMCSAGHMLRVEALKVGEQVRLHDGRTAAITRVHVHEWGLQDIRVLKTCQGNFEVSSSQLIVVFQSGAILRRKAGELKMGDTVFVGKRKQKLLHVLPKKQRTSLYEVSFSPDGQVEAFMVSPWGIHACGEPTAGDTFTNVTEERRHDGSRTEVTEDSRDSDRFFVMLHAMANIPEHDLRNAMPVIYED